MRASRLLSILILLQVRARVTADALAEEFEVSKRTIYRDIDELSAAGIPVYGDRGPGGGFSLLDGYQTKLTGFAESEAEALFMIGMPGPAAALGMGAATTNAGRKIAAALPRASRHAVRRISDCFHLDTTDWYRSTEAVTQLPAVARAVLDQRTLVMTYESWTGVRDCVVNPLGLILKAGSWYLAGQVGEQVRTYRVAKIARFEVSECSFQRPDKFDLPSWWSASLARFEAELRPLCAIISVTRLGLQRLAACGSYAQTAVTAAEPADSNGWARLRLPIETVDQAALLLLSLGPEVVVHAPDELRERLQQLAAGIVSLHKREPVP